MSKKLRITLKIADRSYPLRILPEQEQAYREAAERINKQIAYFEQYFPIKDRQDSLAMCAISLATPLFQESLADENQKEKNIERLEKIHQTLVEISNNRKKVLPVRIVFLVNSTENNSEG